jgi:hypothetical protein
MISSFVLLLPTVQRAPVSTSSGLSATVWVSIAGIVVSGVVGPQLTSRATWRANRRQFNRDQNAKRRDDLRTLLDEAAVLLASGATNLRLIRENAANDRPESDELVDWLGKVFPMSQRLRLRLPESNAVVQAYDSVREALIETQNLAAGIDGQVLNFETKRREFLETARKELDREIPEKVNTND